MNKNLASRRRLLTKILAFVVFVCVDILRLNLNGSGFVNKESNASGSSSHPSHTHIHAIKNTPITKYDNHTRISFQLHDPHTVPFRNIYPPSGCSIGALPDGGIRTGELPPSLVGVRRDGGRILGFTTTISTNLNILQLGDSVSIQIAEALDEMLGADELHSRTVLWEGFPGNVGGSIVAPTRGGGVQGAWRITGLLSKGAQGRPALKNAPGGGWNYDRINPFWNHVYVEDGKNRTMDKKFDVVVFRVMHGWMKAEEITRERIVEAAEMVHYILGTDTFIFLTVPFTNNVMSEQIMEDVSKINDMIRDVAKDWHLEHESRMLVMEFGMFFNHIMWTNARHLGYNVSAPLMADPKTFDVEGPFLLERLNQITWPPSIPMVCNKMPSAGSNKTYCERNILFRDGMHLCLETLAARVGAGIACLLGCVYNKKEGSTGVLFQKKNDAPSPSMVEKQMSKLRACEKKCNEQFMSVMPVRESWIGTNETLASFSGF